MIDEPSRLTLRLGLSRGRRDSEELWFWFKLWFS
jgi:hypothetical protein